MIADISKVADFSSKVNSYSHEAKVNKWLAEQSAVAAEQPGLGADYLAPRRRRPRVDPSLLDWKKLTGEENVSVINRATGKKLTGTKAPTLKRLGQWLMDNPMYDVDPKWAELVKERGNLTHDLHKRLPGAGKKGPGRPPLLASPNGSTTSVSSANLATSIANSLPFPSLAGSGLGSLNSLNSSLLSGLSLGQFDPKNNPLLLPFGGMTNMNALGGLGNMNLFANLAGLGIPGLGGMEAPTEALSSGGKKSSHGKEGRGSSSNSNANAKPPVSSSASSSATSIPSSTSQFPFFFPNPSLLYTPLGLGGLNPFSLQPGMSSAYDTLAQQCGLLNGNMGGGSGKSSKSGRASATTTTTSSSSKARSSTSNIPLQQLLLPHDTHLLESISKVTGGLDPSGLLKGSGSSKKDDKRKALESLRAVLPPDFGPSKSSKRPDLSGLPADFSKFLENPGTSSSSKRSKEQEMKEALEHLSKTSAELYARTLTADDVKAMTSLSSMAALGASSSAAASSSSSSSKRGRESTSSVKDVVPENLTVEVAPASLLLDEPPAKRVKEDVPSGSTRGSSNVGMDVGVDIEALLPPSTVVKSSLASGCAGDTSASSAGDDKLGGGLDSGGDEPAGKSHQSPGAAEDAPESSGKKGGGESLFYVFI